MTRAEDAREAARLGASYVGVIFAGGPRRLTVSQASAVFDGLPPSVRRVGVFAEAQDTLLQETAAALGLHAVQLHGEPGAAEIDHTRRHFGGEVWAVLRIADGALPRGAADVFDVADAVLLDAKVAGQLGGTGVALPWADLAEQLLPLRQRGRAKLVVAGGLHAENVSEAIRLLRPGIVDVSSGVETAPGIKDHARMRAFRDAVHAST